MGSYVPDVSEIGVLSDLHYVGFSEEDRGGTASLQDGEDLVLLSTLS
jgi:hypothetical protein